MAGYGIEVALVEDCVGSYGACTQDHITRKFLAASCSYQAGRRLADKVDKFRPPATQLPEGNASAASAIVVALVAARAPDPRSDIDANLLALLKHLKVELSSSEARTKSLL